MVFLLNAIILTNTVDLILEYQDIVFIFERSLTNSPSGIVRGIYSRYINLLMKGE